MQIQFNSQLGDSTTIEGLSVDSEFSEKSPWSAQASYTSSGQLDQAQSPTVTANALWNNSIWNAGGGFEYGNNPEASTSRLGPSVSLGRRFGLSSMSTDQNAFRKTIDASVSYQVLRYTKQPLSVPGATIDPAALSATLDQKVLALRSSLNLWSYLSLTVGYSNFSYGDNLSLAATNFGQISSFARGTAFSQITGLPSDQWILDLSSTFAPSWNIDLLLIRSRSAITGQVSRSTRAILSKTLNSQWSVSLGAEQDVSDDTTLWVGLFNVARSF